MTGLARPELLATTDWLVGQLERPDLRLVDVRWRPDGSARRLYASGHVPGAMWLDWSEDLVEREESGVFRLAGPDRVAGALAHLGIGDTTTVVLYDDTMGFFASRVWWSLRAYGFESARVLDGGFPAWVAEGRPVSTAPGHAERASFALRPKPSLRLATSDVRGLLGSPDVSILDARAPAEYRGHEGNTRRLGHIPGALNVPVGAMSQPGSQLLRDGAQLRELLQRAGVSRGRRAVCYDGSGIGAARLAFVLTLLGYEDVAVYDGGWAEWGERLDLPVER